jgi:hypothetical protein
MTFIDCPSSDVLEALLPYGIGAGKIWKRLRILARRSVLEFMSDTMVASAEEFHRVSSNHVTNGHWSNLFPWLRFQGDDFTKSGSSPWAI